MFGLNVISDFRKESKPSLREVLAGISALSRLRLREVGLAARFSGLSGRGALFAAALGAGVIGGLGPAALFAHHSLADAASLSRAVDKLQKLELQQTADAAVVRTIAQADAALQARLDSLEKRLTRAERASLDPNPTGAISSSDRPSPPAKPDSKRKPKS